MVELSEDEKYLTDFSTSIPAHSVTARFCGCGAIHLSFHDSDLRIYAHADMIKVEEVELLIDFLQKQANVMRIKQESDNEATSGQ